MDVRINREIRDYSEKMALGLTLREAVFSGIAIAASGSIFFVLRESLHMEIVSWVCAVAAAPFVFLGFFKYHELPAEKVVLKIITEKRGSRYLTFAVSDIYEELKRGKRENEIKDSKGYSRRAKGKKKRI